MSSLAEMRGMGLVGECWSCKSFKRTGKRMGHVWLRDAGNFGLTSQG